MSEHQIKFGVSVTGIQQATGQLERLERIVAKLQSLPQARPGDWAEPVRRVKAALDERTTVRQAA